jgi:hypothetical protein
VPTKLKTQLEYALGLVRIFVELQPFAAAGAFASASSESCADWMSFEAAVDADFLGAVRAQVCCSFVTEHTENQMIWSSFSETFFLSQNTKEKQKTWSQLSYDLFHSLTLCRSLSLSLSIPPIASRPHLVPLAAFTHQCAARAHRQAQKLLGLYRATKAKAALLAAKVEVRTAGGGVEVLRCAVCVCV